MWAHRILLIGLFVLFAFQIVFVGNDVAGKALISAMIVDYIAMAWLALRLIDEAEIDFTPIPAWIIYVFTGGFAVLVSMWLDREVARLLERNRWEAGFTHFAKA